VQPVAREVSLQASRRIDWRFLLPTPDLGGVACIGVDDDDLLDSLALFRATLKVAESASGEDLDGSHDVVVLRNPPREVVEVGSRLLRPGGWLYLEVENSSSSRAPGAPGSVRACARELRRCGLLEVRTHVHWPDFASCRAIVPLDEVSAVRHGLARGSANGGWFVTRLAPVLAATRQLGPFVPCASAIGRRPDQGEKP
jgi:hypothetical protein